eukprot:Awhi_evm1s14894
MIKNNNDDNNNDDDTNDDYDDDDDDNILSGLTNYTYVNIEFLDWLAIKGYDTVVSNWDAVVQQTLLAGDFLVTKQQEIKDGIIYFESKEAVLSNITKPLVGFAHKNKEILNAAAQWT